MALEGVVSTVAGEILNLLGSQASQCFGMLCGLNDDLHKLKSNVSSIQAVLRDAEERQIKDNDHSLTDWLEKLGDVLYEVDDVLDEISTEALRREVMTRDKNAKQVRIFFSNSNQLAFNYRMSCQLKKVNERLDVISEEKNKFHFNLNVEPRIQNNHSSHHFGMGRETHSSLSGQKIIGRDDDMNNLKKLLLADDENVKASNSFIAIVGMGGIGKTTLAKALYNDEDVLGCFYPRIWVWVSDQFNTNTILKKIIESATGEKSEVERTEALKTKLQKVIEGKKFLLVMDDVWNENENEWENLKSLLMVGARGSKILITKRDSIAVPDFKMVPLKDLSEDTSWKLFKEVAFKESDLESTNSDLIELGIGISKKCGGIPLVIRHIGRLLYGKTSKEEWVYVKNNELLNVVTRGQNNNDEHVISTLKLSYSHLRPNLKLCFAYTYLFPKGYKIRSNELIRQWMAQGFIESSNGGKSMEDIGNDYLNELCWRFFYEISSGEDGYGDIVSMHDVMRDLAKEVAGKKLYVRGDPKKEYVVSEQTRHISLDYKIIKSHEDVLSKLLPAKGLRTFILFNLDGGVSSFDGVVFDKLFSSFPRLRVLGLKFIGISTLSMCIRKLRHLRYLDLSENSFLRSLSNSITELQNLQTLNLTSCLLFELPKDTGNLINLRYLGVDYYAARDMPKGMEKLSCLQTLNVFVLDCKNVNKLREFSKLNCFIERLTIKGLEQLRSIIPSKLGLINLKDKKGNRSLILDWKLKERCDHEYEGVSESDERIMEGLEPHPNVQVLLIKGYCGVGLPNWLSTSHFNYLTEFYINDCPRLQHLTQLGHLQALKGLCLEGLRSLMSLSEWIGNITSLEVFYILKCPKLKSLPEGMRQLKSLNYLHIVDCPQLEKRCKEGGEDWPNISHIPIFTYETDTHHYTPLSFSDDEDNAIANSEKKGKMKDCLTNIASFFHTCGSTSSNGLYTFEGNE